MNDKPEVPNSGSDPYASGDTSRPETPRIPSSSSDGTPTVNIGGSYSGAPTSPGSPVSSDTPAYSYNDPYAWKPGQYNAGANPGSEQSEQGQPTRYTPPQPASNPLPQYAPPPPQYNPAQYPQGQPTQYNPPVVQQPYAGGYPQPQQGQYPQQQQGQYPPYAYAAPVKDPTVGLLLELIGYLGFLGIGHIYAGKTARGVALMFGYWAYLLLSAFLTIFLVGCIMLLATLIVPILSGFYLKNEMEREQAAMGIRRY